MRWSKLFIPTLREDQSNVEAASHNLLLRAGFIRQLTAGVYSLLPLAQRVRLKIINLIRQEMNKIGAQEFFLSALQPLELWDESGRKEAVSDVMFRLKDRKSAELALGLTHEEVFTSIARAGLSSYKQLPQIWYQIQSKFRDEARPRAGLLRVREFTMKDSYSFDFDEEGLDHSFNLHDQAYREFFDKCGLDFVAVQASSGAMGGSASTEFMLLTEAGEDTIVLCSSCNYSANIERAECKVENPDDGDELKSLAEFSTPGIKTIKQLEDFENGAAANRQIKTLVYQIDSDLILALLRGDQELNESKLQSALSCSFLRPADEAAIFTALGAHPGSLGACGVKAGPENAIKRIIADKSLQHRKNMLTGANKDDFHFSGVSLDRDIKVDLFADLHTVQAGQPCVDCGAPLRTATGLELGHIFKLGRRYSEAMNARVLSSEGERVPVYMGSYGIGVERLMAAVAERWHDDKGLRWPFALAPYTVLVLAVHPKDEQQKDLSEKIYSQLQQKNIEVLLDDRDERAGVKFNDADLIGVPLRVTVGRKAGSGIVEILNRFSGIKEEIPADDLIPYINAAIAAGA
jgi:prolyl-tRNA synthetase